METASSASSGDLIVAARQLAVSARNLSTEIDRDRRLPDQLAEQLKEAGLFRMLLGQEFGGLEANPITATQVVEIISESNASAGWVVMILASTSCWASALLPDAAVQEVFLKGPEISMAGTLVPQGKAVKSEGVGCSPDGGPSAADVSTPIGWPVAVCWCQRLENPS